MSTVKEIQNVLAKELVAVELLRAGNTSVEVLTKSSKSDVLVIHTKGGIVHLWADKNEEPYHRLHSRVHTITASEGQVVE